MFWKNNTLRNLPSDKFSDGSKVFGSHIAKERISIKSFSLLPNSCIKKFQSESNSKSFPMMFSFNRLKNLNGIIWIFGKRVWFLKKVWCFIVIKWVRNWKIIKIVISKIAISQHPAWIRGWFSRRASTLNQGRLWKYKKLILGEPYFQNKIHFQTVLSRCESHRAFHWFY